jgi:hypothetical protein
MVTLMKMISKKRTKFKKTKQGKRQVASERSDLKSSQRRVFRKGETGGHWRKYQRPILAVKISYSEYLIQEGPQLTQAFLLRKEKPNFIPKQLAEKFKRDQEAKEQQELSAHVDKELLEEEMSKQVIKKAELQTHKLTVPRPQFTLDEDDEEFED